MRNVAVPPTVLLSTSTNYRSDGLLRADTGTSLNYSEAVAAAGGTPVLAPALPPEHAAAYARVADALLLTGGVDIDPALYGAAPDRELGTVDGPRDAFEIALYHAFRDAGKPVLGICRGLQVINVAEGGTLHQHLPAVDGSWQHEQRNPDGAPLHPVRLEPGSRLHAAFGTTDIRTNSYHHQAIDRLGGGLRAVATTGDGIVEAVEESSGSFVLGVQWHPEMAYGRHLEHRAPFDLFLAAVLASRPRTPELSLA